MHVIGHFTVPFLYTSMVALNMKLKTGEASGQEEIPSPFHFFSLVCAGQFTAAKVVSLCFCFSLAHHLQRLRSLLWDFCLPKVHRGVQPKLF